MKLVVSVREGIESDKGIIWATMPKGVYYSGRSKQAIHKTVWFSHFHSYLANLLDTGLVFVACIEGDPSTILGYSLFQGECLHYVYVKKDFRRNGIGALLVEQVDFTSIHVPNITVLAYNILNK
jgi:hypothetical protein